MVKSVLVELERADKEGVSPVVVVGDSPYREDGYKGNVWTRFFDPIGDEALPVDEEVAINSHPSLPMNDCYFHNRIRMSQTVQHWVRPNADTRAEIARYTEAFCRYKTAMHYRGTDKGNEVSFVAPEHYFHALENIRSENEPWFLATDAAPVVSVAQERRPCLFIDTERSPTLTSGYGMHFRVADRGAQGRSAVIDAWLLSRASILICGPSNLSEFVTYLNPSIVVASMR